MFRKASLLCLLSALCVAAPLEAQTKKDAKKGEKKEETKDPAEAKPRTEHSIWNYLLTHSDAGTANRLRSDPAFQVDPRLLTVQLNEDGTRGFSVSVEQLLRERAL